MLGSGALLLQPCCFWCTYLRPSLCVLCVCCQQWPVSVSLCESEERSSQQSRAHCTLFHIQYTQAGETENIHFYIRQPAIGSRAEGQVGQPYSSPVTPKEKNARNHTHTLTHSQAHTYTRARAHTHTSAYRNIITHLSRCSFSGLVGRLGRAGSRPPKKKKKKKQTQVAKRKGRSAPVQKCTETGVHWLTWEGSVAINSNSTGHRSGVFGCRCVVPRGKAGLCVTICQGELVNNCHGAEF